MAHPFCSKRTKARRRKIFFPKFFLALFALPLLVSCSRNSPANVGGVEVPAELLAAADDAGFDYTGNLHKALQNNDLALATLFSFSEKTDSAAVGQHGKTLAALLQKNGDEAFSKQLAQQNLAVKRSVWMAFDEAGLPASLKTAAPLTWKTLLPPGEPQEARGLFIPGEKFDTYLDCAKPGAKLVAMDETGNIERNYKRLLRRPYPGQAIFAEVKGYLSDHYGATRLPDNHQGFFIITEIIELEAKNHRNTCIPFDYWASGTEPFWSAQISAGEDLIEFYDPSEDKFTVFNYAPPVTTDTAQVYAAFNQSTGDNIRISVRKEVCSDGMSDIRHEYAVKLTVNGKGFSGCGISWEKSKVD